MILETQFPQPVLVPVPNSGEMMEFFQDYYVTLPVSQKTLLVKKGFRIDGTSIPFLFWTISRVSPFDPDFLAGASAHDPLYEAELLTREQCDDEFEAILKMNSIRSKSQAVLFFDAVRIGGELVWARHTPESISSARQFCSLSN